jgi:SAM-dependent methyltransferase
MTTQPDKPEYEESFIERLELMWGKGFLSPGGADEVRAILSGEDLARKRVLDIGCGAGGAALLLVREYDVAEVVGIDVVPLLVEKARRLSSRTGLGDRIVVKLVEPGRLPFEDGAFDAVFTKDSLLHMPDKLAAFREIHRVLRPGGLFLGSDWLAGENINHCESWARFMELRRPSFVMVRAEAMIEAMRASGFENIAATDRNAWFVNIAAHDLHAVEGPLRDELQRLLGSEAYHDWLAVRRAIAGAASSGALRPTHLRSVKPRAAE